MKFIKNFLSLTNAAVVAVIALIMLVYWPGLGGAFVLDDSTSIVAIHIPNPDWNALVYNVTHNTSGLLGRSVTILSFMLTEWQFGLSPWGYKFHNLLLHLANGLLIYRLLYLLLPLLEPRIRPVNVALTAGITTSFWLLHPLLVSTVLYAVQRMVEMAVFFSLLALLSYFHARSRNGADLKFFIYGWVLFPLTLILALLSKEIGALVPVYVLIIEFLVFKTTLQSLTRQRHIIFWLLFFIFIPMALAGLYLLTHFSELADYDSRNFTLYERLLTQLHVVAYYTKSILFPRIKEMSLFQDDFALTQTMDGSTLILLGVLVLLLASIWYLRNRAPVFAFGIAWFLGSHLLESTFLPLELVFEHRNYLGAMGLLLPPIYYTLQIQKKDLQPLRWLMAVFFVVFVGQTYSRVQEWSNTGVMLTVAVNDHPTSSRARTEYANYLYSQGRRDETLEQLKISTELDTRNAGPVVHQLVVLCLQGKDQRDLLSEAEKRLSTWPASPYTLSAINKLMSTIVRGECKQVSMRDLELLLLAGLSQPGNLQYAHNHGTFLSFMGLLNFLSGNYQKGVDLYTEDYKLTGNLLVLSQLARYQIQFKQYEAAEKTIASIEEINKARFGIDTHTVTQLSKALVDARMAAIPAELEVENL